MKMVVADMDNLVTAMCDYLDVAEQLALSLESDIKSPSRQISSGTVLALSKLVSLGGGLDKVLSIIESKGTKAH